MKKTIRLTESDIKRIVMSVLNESLKHEEAVKDASGRPVTNINVLADGWRNAVLDKMNGGQGVAMYGKREYTVIDWTLSIQMSQIFTSYAMKAITSAIGSEIARNSKKKVKAFLNRVHGMGITDVAEFKTREDLKDNEYVQNLLHQANEMMQPSQDEKYGFYSEFFYDSDVDSSLMNKCEEIASKVSDGDAKDVVNAILKYLATYSIHKYRIWLQQGGNVSTAMGNMSLSNPVTNEKDIDYFDGESFINGEAERNTTDYDSLSPENFADMGSDKASIPPLKKLKYMLGLILSGRVKIRDPRSDPNDPNPRMIDVSEFVYKKDGSTLSLKPAVQYMYDHFEEIFNMSEMKDQIEAIASNDAYLSRGQKREVSAKVALQDYIRKRVAFFIYKGYQRAYETNDKNDYIIKMFRQKQGEHVYPKTLEDFNANKSPMKYLWSLISSATNSDFAFGNALLMQFKEDYELGLVSESRRMNKIRLTESQLKHIVKESVSKILNADFV